MPAWIFYSGTASVTMGMLGMLWIGLADSEPDSIVSVLVVFGLGATSVSIFVREVVLRGAARRRAMSERRLDSVFAAVKDHASHRTSEKLQLNEHSSWLAEIQRKSEAAEVLGSVAKAHLEVFELCGEYLRVVSEQLQVAGAGSPRIPVFLEGRQIVAKLHHQHLLKWVELEVRVATDEAAIKKEIGDKIALTTHALDCLTRGLSSYPSDRVLTESKKVIAGVLLSLEVADACEQIRKFSSAGNLVVAREIFENKLEAMKEAVSAREIDEEHLRLLEAQLLAVNPNTAT